jgi:quinol monooxygenase YgiN
MGDSAAIVVVVGMKVQDGRADELIAAFEPCIAATRQEEGNLGYALHRDAGDPDHFVMIEHWRSQADIDEHMTKPYLAELMKASGSVLAEPPVFWLTTPV